MWGVGGKVYSMWMWGRGGRSVLDVGVGKGREGCTRCGCREGEGGVYSVWLWRKRGVYLVWVWGRGGRGVLGVVVGKERGVLGVGVGKGREGCTRCACGEGERRVYLMKVYGRRFWRGCTRCGCTGGVVYSIDLSRTGGVRRGWGCGGRRGVLGAARQNMKRAHTAAHRNAESFWWCQADVSYSVIPPSAPPLPAKHTPTPYPDPTPPTPHRLEFRSPPVPLKETAQR